MNTLLVILAAPALAAQQPQKDRVILKQAAPVEGVIQKETYKDVLISTAGGAQTVKVEDILRIEYGDAPPAFRGAMATLEQERWSDALNSLRSAEELFNAKDLKGITKPRAFWFLPALAYYRGVCLLQLGRSADAIAQFDKIRKEYKESRFLADAYEMILQAYRERKDTKAMDAFEKEADAAPTEIRQQLKIRAKRQRAELLLDMKQYAEARKIFEAISLSTDPELATSGAWGVIQCLIGLKDTAVLQAYCKKVLSTAGHAPLLLIASNAIADDLFEKRQYAQARDAYVQSVVRYNPGRTASGAEREHERALYQLARCYEELWKAAKEGKEDIARMCASTYRELAIEYPSGRYIDEAAGKAVAYEKRASEKKTEKK